MVRNLRSQSQRKHRRPRRHQLASHEDILCRYSACTCRIDVYGHHDGMEVCAAEIDCLLILAAGVLIPAIPDSSNAEGGPDDAIVILQRPGVCES